MSYIGYIYSIDDNIKISHLKSGDYDKNIDTTTVSKYISDNKIQILTQNESYHQKFLYIPSKPYIIYAIGNLDLLDSNIIGMVGPRKPSDYGNKIICQTISLISNKQNIATISGLADGIDELVHTQSIKNNIPTIAVLGGGLSYFLNSNKKDLIKKIVDNGGLVISEFRLKQKPAPYTFPQRNRIVAGLSDMIFLAEAGDNSGSLITVNFGINMGKKIFVVPGDIYASTSFGSNKILNHNGVEAVYDIPLRVNNNFGIQNSNTNNQNIIENKYDNLTDLQKIILQYIIDGKNSIDSILQQKNELNYELLMVELSILEIEEYIYSPMPGIFATK